MLFNSIEFAFFLPVVFSLYWLVSRSRTTLRTWILLAASYVFYGWWDWRFLSLIVGSSLVDYFVGRRLEHVESQKKRRWLLAASLIVNLGLLGTFKYYNFFVESFDGAFSFLGVPIRGRPLQLVLPVGISFYTFQTMSYSIDVYRRRLAPAHQLVPFLAYVAFFPQLVAGPIERATHLLPQFFKQPAFDSAAGVDGLRQMLWGLFKKMVIADNCAPLVNDIFAGYGTANSGTLALGAVLFAFQIYGDFSGYSDIAIGTARLFGFDLMQNFAYPYFSRDIAEFWRRWHISLSTWFRDYLYIPLGGSRARRGIQIRNIFIVFLVSGLWHGASWTFVIWGGIHALLFLPLLLRNRNRSHLGVIAEGRLLPTVTELGGMVSTFAVVCVAWVFFRAESVRVAFQYLVRMFDFRNLGAPSSSPGRVMLFIAIMLVVEWFGRGQKHALAEVRLPRTLRWLGYFSLGYAVLLLGAGAQNFIYFQF